MSEMDTILADILQPASTPAPDVKPVTPIVSPPTEKPDATPTEKPDAPKVEEKTPPYEVKEDDKPSDADADDDETDDGETPDAAAHKRKPGSVKMRERAQRAEARAQELEQELARTRQPPPPQGDDEAAQRDMARYILNEIGPPPKREEFNDYLTYERRATAWEQMSMQLQREYRHVVTQQRQRQHDAAQGMVSAFETKVIEARKTIPDYDAVIEAGTPLRHRAVGQAIMQHQKGALLAHYLAAHPDTVERLNAMPVPAAIMEIGSLGSRLSVPKPKTETKAPPPVEPNSGGSPSAAGTDNIENDASWKKFAKKHGYD